MSLQSALNGKANTSHTHTTSQISGLYSYIEQILDSSTSAVKVQYGYGGTSSFIFTIDPLLMLYTGSTTSSLLLDLNIIIRYSATQGCSMRIAINYNDVNGSGYSYINNFNKGGAFNVRNSAGYVVFGI